MFWRFIYCREAQCHNNGMHIKNPNTPNPIFRANFRIIKCKEIENGHVVSLVKRQKISLAEETF